MAGFLTTHVLDTARGCPAAGLHIALFHIDAGARLPLAGMVTNADGRTDGPILPEDRFQLGIYELVFQAGQYLRGQKLVTAQTMFLDEIPIRFRIIEQTHYHVPLLLSPYGYSTYRGS